MRPRGCLKTMWNLGILSGSTTILPRSEWLTDSKLVGHWWQEVSCFTSRSRLITHNDSKDSAHVHSPTGGQGLNSGFVDAVSYTYVIYAEPMLTPHCR